MDDNSLLDIAVRSAEANLKNQQGFIVKNLKESELTYNVKNVMAKHEKHILEHYMDIVKMITQYISKNSSALSTRGPTQRVPFVESDKAKLFEITGANKEDLLNALRQSGHLKQAGKTGKDYRVIGDPFNILCSYLIFLFYKHDSEFKYPKKDAYRYYNLISIYLTIRFYTSVYIRQFQYDPDKTIMDYTVENLSNKFLLKKLNNMFELIKKWAESNIENMESIVVRFADVDIAYFISNLDTRIGQNMNGISEEFYRNHKENKRYNVDNMAQEDEEGDMFVGDVKSISGDIEVLTRKIQVRFISDSIIDLHLLNLACNKTQVSKSKMSLIINKIRDADDKLLHNIIRLIISYYLDIAKSNVHSVKSNEFITRMIKVYKISNTNNEFKIEIAKTLDEVLKKYSAEYLKTSREATLSSMRSALYIYLVLYIAKNAD